MAEKPEKPGLQFNRKPFTARPPVELQVEPVEWNQVRADGLEEQVERLFRNGDTDKEIANKLDLHKAQVEDWRVKSERHLATPKRGKNVFDVADNLQVVMQDLETMLHEFEGSQDVESELYAFDEYHKCLKLIHQLSEQFEERKKELQYQQTVLDIIDMHAPGTKARILDLLLRRGGSSITDVDTPIELLVEELTTDQKLVSVSKQEKEVLTLIEKAHQNKVQTMGLGGDVIRMRQAKMTYKEIGHELGINEISIRNWCHAFAESTPEKRKAMLGLSMFDIADSLQGAYTRLRKMMEDRAIDTSGKVQVINRLLKFLKLASTVAQQLIRRQQSERFNAVVKESLSDMELKPRTKVIEQLQVYYRELHQLKLRG